MSKHKTKWADAVTKAVGVKPGDIIGRNNIGSHVKSVWYGLMDEYRPKITLAEMTSLAGVSGCTHTTAFEAVRRWRDLPWAERYGWLLLADSMYGPSSRRGDWAVSDIADQSLFVAAEWRRKHREKAGEKPSKINIPGHYDER